MQNSLKQLRKTRRLTLKTLSEKTGVALSTINNFENGRSGMSQELLQKLADFLGVPASEILAHDPGGRIEEEPEADYARMKKVINLREIASPEQIELLDNFLDSLTRMAGGKE